MPPKKEATKADQVVKGKKLIWQDFANAPTWPERGYNWAHKLVTKGKKEFGKEIINGLIKHHQNEGDKEFRDYSAELVEEIRAVCFKDLADAEAKARKGFSNPYKDRKGPALSSPPAASSPTKKEAASSPKKDGQPPRFIPAGGFEGSKPGYSFQTGDSGLGYYLEPTPTKKAEATSVSTPSGNQIKLPSGVCSSNGATLWVRIFHRKSGKGAQEQSRSALKALAKQACDLYVCDAEKPDKLYVLLKGAQTWPLESLAAGLAFSANTKGVPANKNVVEQTWTGPAAPHMIKIHPAVEPGWLYHANGNGNGLCLKDGEYCGFQWLKSHKVEVWLGFKDGKALDAAVATDPDLQATKLSKASAVQCFVDEQAQTDKKPSFIPASQFEGSKPGYSFQTGDSGLGYYHLSTAAVPPQAASPKKEATKPAPQAAEPIDTKTQLYGPAGKVYPKSFYSETIARYALQEPHLNDDTLRVLQCNHGFDLEIVELCQSNHKETTTLTLNPKDKGELMLHTMVQDSKTQKNEKRTAYRLETEKGGHTTPLCLGKNGRVTFGEHDLIPPARAASPTLADAKDGKKDQPGSIITYLVLVLDCVGIMYKDATTGQINWAGALGVSKLKNERLLPSEKVIDQAKTKLATLIKEDRIPIISNLSGSGANPDRRSNLVRYSKFSAVSADGKGSAVSWDGKTLARSSHGTPCKTEGAYDGSVLQMRNGDLFLTDVKHRESVRQRLWPPYHGLVCWDQCPLYQLVFHKGNVVYLDHRGVELARNWERGHMFAGVLDARKADAHRKKYNVVTAVLIGGASGGLYGCCDLYRQLSKLGNDHPHLEITRHDVLKVNVPGVCNWECAAASVLRDLEEWGMIPTYTGDSSKCSGVGRRFVLFGISMGGGVIPQVGQEIVSRCGPEALLAQVHQCGQSAGASVIKALPQSVSIYLYHGDSDTTVSWAKTGNTVHGYATKNPKRRVEVEILKGVNHDLGQDKAKFRWCWELMWRKLVLEWLSYEMRRPVPKGFCDDNAVMPSQKGALFPEQHPGL